MAEPIAIDVIVVEPVLLELNIAPVTYIGTAQAGPRGEKGDPLNVMTGARSSAVDAGNFGEISLADDYVYFCVLSGTAGNAVWKKSLMFST